MDVSAAVVIRDANGVRFAQGLAHWGSEWWQPRLAPSERASMWRRRMKSTATAFRAVAWAEWPGWICKERNARYIQAFNVR